MATGHAQLSEEQPREIDAMREVLRHETGHEVTDAQASAALRAALEAVRIETARAQLGAELVKLPDAVPPGAARAAQATENVWRAIEAKSGLLTSAQVAEILGSRSSPAAVRSLANDMRKRGALLAVQRLNRYVYPGFQFDFDHGSVAPWVAPYAELASEFGWGQEDALLWLWRPTTYLPNAARPIDFIGADPETVFDVARRAWGVAW